MRAHSVLFGCLAMVACNGSTLDLGAGDASTDTTRGHAPVLWSGYLENYNLMSGSDHVALSLVVGPDESVTGTVFFGDPPPLDAPTDPEKGYPPSAAGIGGGLLGGVSTLSDVVEHFDFTILAGKLDGQRLTLSLVRTELWKKWCELQTTIYPLYNYVPDGGTGPLVGYGCLPNSGSSATNGACTFGDASVDCVKLALCDAPARTCTCTQSACTVDVSPMSADIKFDLQLTGDAGMGSVTGLSSTPINVHLQRN